MFAQSIEGYLSQQIPFSLSYERNSHTVVSKACSRTERLYHWAFNRTVTPLIVDASLNNLCLAIFKRSIFHLNARANCAALALYLEDLPRKAPHEVLLDSTLMTIRKYLKLIPKQYAEDCFAIRECNRQLLALRLGINAGVFEANPGFEEFAKKGYLYNFLAAYKDRLQIDPATREVRVKYKKQMVKWSDVPEAIKVMPPKKFTYMPWKYGRNGLKNRNLYEWKEIKPFYIADPKEWDYRFVIGLCTTCVARPRTTAGDHSFLRLYDGETGRIYSVGLYRPDKGLEESPRKNPLRIKPGYLMLDASEYWGEEIQEIRVGITKDQFLAMKEQLERDKTREIKHTQSAIKIENPLIFQLMETNCTAYVAKIAALGNIKLPSQATFFHILFPRKVMWIFDLAVTKAPAPIRKMIILWAAFIGNLIQVYFGARKVDSRISAEAIARPAIQTWGDMFNIEKIKNYSPFILGQVTRLEVENWRAEEKQRLTNIYNASAQDAETTRLYKQRLGEVDYDLPRKFRVN